MASKVSISEKPKAKVSGLTALTRKSGGSYEFESKWKLDSSAKQESNKARVEGFDIEILLHLYDVRDGKNAKRKKTLTYSRSYPNDKDRTNFVFNLGSFKLKKSSTYTYTRANDFYPGANAHWLGIRVLTIRVRCTNSKGAGPWVAMDRDITKPKPPKVSKLEMVESTGIINCTVTHDKGEGYAENYNTAVNMNVWDSIARDNMPESHKLWYIYHTESSGSNNTIDVYDRMGNTYNDFRQVTVSTYTRGLWGPSDTVTERLQVGWPKQPKIMSVDIAEKKNSNGSTYLDAVGKVTVNIDTFTHPSTEAKNNVINHHPATGVKLERLVNQPYRKVEEIPGDADWVECGALDNGVCEALSSTVAELRSTPGNYTWIRLKSWNIVENIFFRYSMPWRLTKLYVAPQTTTDDRATIYMAQVGDDGKSAVIGFQWRTDESTGTEVSWSDDPHAWESTNEPETFNVTRKDGTRTVSGVTYNYAILYVADLTEGKEYYFKVRRYEETDDDPRFGPYSATQMVTPYSSPDSVTLVAPTFVRRGSTATFSWSFETEATQKRWELICGAVTETTEQVRIIGTDTYVTRTRYTIADERTVKTLAVGEDELTGYTVSWENVEPRLVDNDHIFVAVRVDTGGGYVLSDAMRVEIADAPIISDLTADTLTAQPLSIGVTCDMAAQLSLTVRSSGVTGEYAEGDRIQAEGDTVWAVATTPEWVEDNGTFTATITAPDGLALYDGAEYNITCVATDADTNISSEEVATRFSVDYAHKATPPAESITVEPYDTTDAVTGYRTRGAVIRLAPPVYNLVEWFSHDLADTTYWNGTDQADYGVQGGNGWLNTTIEEGTVAFFAPISDIGGTYLVEWRDVVTFGIRCYMTLGDTPIDLSEPSGSVLMDNELASGITIEGGFTGSIRVSQYAMGYEGVYAPPTTTTAAASDVYDIFRVTPDGPYLIAEDVALDAVVDDPWAPYGETHYYRVRTRTADGDEEYADYPYELAGRDLRIDYGNTYLELPYDLSVSDQYDKDFEARRHLDGSVDGYWNQGAVRRGNLKTNIIKARDADKAAALRALGRHAGPCYVRLPDGCAYQADVQLSGIDRESDSFAMAVSISATEVALTADYMAIVPTEEGE